MDKMWIDSEVGARERIGGFVRARLGDHVWDSDDISAEGDASIVSRAHTPSLRVELVPGAADGYDRLAAELLSQVAHVHVDYVRSGVVVVAPDV